MAHDEEMDDADALFNLHSQRDKLKRMHSWNIWILFGCLFIIVGSAFLYRRSVPNLWWIHVGAFIGAYTTSSLIIYLLRRRCRAEEERYRKDWSKLLRYYSDKRWGIEEEIPTSMREIVEEYGECTMRVFQLEVMMRLPD